MNYSELSNRIEDVEALYFKIHNFTYIEMVSDLLKLSEEMYDIIQLMKGKLK